MKPGTLVVVGCYSGDVHLVERAAEMYAHHGWPVLLLSPEDAPACIEHPRYSFMCRSVGLNSYDQSLDRYRLQLQTLLEYPASWFLYNEADSFCLSAAIPPELYADSAVVWSNTTDIAYYLPIKNEPNPEAVYEQCNPAMNAPWFFSRTALQRMLAHFDEAVEVLPPYSKGDITWWFHSALKLAGLRREGYGSLGVSAAYVPEAPQQIRDGAVMIHAVKEQHVWNEVTAAYGGGA